MSEESYARVILKLPCQVAMIATCIGADNDGSLCVVSFNCFSSREFTKHKRSRSTKTSQSSDKLAVFSFFAVIAR